MSDLIMTQKQYFLDDLEFNFLYKILCQGLKPVLFIHSWQRLKIFSTLKCLVCFENRVGTSVISLWCLILKFITARGKHRRQGFDYSIYVYTNANQMSD